MSEVKPPQEEILTKVNSKTAGCEQCFGSREQWKAVWKK